MSEVPTDKILNGIPHTRSENVVKNGNLNPNEDTSNFLSCASDGDSCAAESDIALRNAYFVLRDRYNKLKLENQKLQKQMQKVIDTSPEKKLLKSNSDAEWNSSVKKPALPRDNKTIVNPIIQISDGEPLSAGTLISELEQLREWLDKMSREAQGCVDTDLKDMMVNVIPKLKELERQCSSKSEEGPRSLVSLLSKETPVRSADDEPFASQKSDDGTSGKRQSITQSGNQSSSQDLLASSCLDNALPYQSTVNLVNDLLSCTSAQSNDLKHICEILRQQNERLKKMDSNPTVRQSIPQPAIANDPPESDWSLIT